MNQKSPYNAEFQTLAKELKAKGLVGVVCIFIGRAEEERPEGIPLQLWIEFAGNQGFTQETVAVILAAAAKLAHTGTPDKSILPKAN